MQIVASSLSPQVQAALVAAAAGLFLAAAAAVGGVMSRNRQRQRDLYSKAYKVAMSWNEMLYRIRRREHTHEAEVALIEKFHDLQEEIDYYQGWIGSESRWLVRSYCKLVAAVKAATRDPIHRAWGEKARRDPAEGARPDDAHPDCKEASDLFLKDVRSHLSLLVLPRLFVVWRNRVWLRRKK